MSDLNLLNAMTNYEPAILQEFYESEGFEPVANPVTMDTELVKNCKFTPEYYAPAKGSGETQGTEPDWKNNSEGSDKQYCIVMGKAKVKGFNFGDVPMQCLLNKTSYDNGDFELGTLYSSKCKIYLLDAEGEKHSQYNEIYFTVFENEATNNDMSDLAADKFQAWLAAKKAKAAE